MNLCPFKVGERVMCVDGAFKGQICVVKSCRYNGMSGWWVMVASFVNKDGLTIEMRLRERDVCKVL